MQSIRLQNCTNDIFNIERERDIIMKYIVFNGNKDFVADIDTMEFDNQTEAIEEADRIWSRRLTDDEKKTQTVYILESANPDEDAADHFDGNTIWQDGKQLMEEEINMDKKVFDTMINEYKDACRNRYEVMYGEKVNTSYTIKNRHTNEVINGTVSGYRKDEESKEVMMAIRRMMISIFGNKIEETLEEIREEIRKEEKMFFKANPKLIVYVTDIR